jgi:hypothetical protein
MDIVLPRIFLRLKKDIHNIINIVTTKPPDNNEPSDPQTVSPATEPQDTKLISTTDNMDTQPEITTLDVAAHGNDSSDKPEDVTGMKCIGIIFLLQVNHSNIFNQCYSELENCSTKERLSKHKM